MSSSHHSHNLSLSTTDGTMERETSSSHLPAESPVASEASTVAVEDAESIVDQRVSPETQSLLSNSTHMSDLTHHINQAEDHEHEDNASSYSVGTEAAEHPSRDRLDQSPPLPITSADDSIEDTPSATIEDAGQQEPSSDLDASNSLLQSESPIGSRFDKPWQPATMRTSLVLCTLVLTLSFTTIVSGALIVSEARQGLMFAPRISELPFWKSFTYLYLPTLLSVLYGLYWSWIDLDVKRLQPYSQLGRSKGASGADSLLLDYPFQFMASIPYKAAKHKHWPVLVGSVTFMLVAMSLTPFQAGLFAVRAVTFSRDSVSQYATGYTPTSKQVDLNPVSAQYAYNIAWLNETLPPFMTREFMLASFGPTGSRDVSSHEKSNFTGSTTLYSVDVTYEPSQDTRYESYELSGQNYTSQSYRSSLGCETSLVQIMPFQNETDVYHSEYDRQSLRRVTRNDTGSDCEEKFWTRWSERPLVTEGSNDTRVTSATLLNQIRPGVLVTPFLSTALFCKTFYYQQLVDATISLSTKQVLAAVATSAKQSLPEDLFNIPLFEQERLNIDLTREVGYVSQGLYPQDANLMYPTSMLPEQANNLRIVSPNPTAPHQMSGLAIAAYRKPLHDYLDAETLRLSYQAAYRLLFCRQMAQILGTELDIATNGVGQLSYHTEAVQVVPEFAYIVLSILGVVVCLCVILWFLTRRQCQSLTRDPGSIRALMDLVKSSPDLISHFRRSGESNTKILTSQLSSTISGLESHGNSGDAALKLLGNEEHHDYQQAIEPGLDQPSDHSTKRDAQPIPVRLLSGLGFLLVQLLAIAAFSALYGVAKSINGLPLPTTSTFGRQMLENYIPIMAAAGIEAFWLLINRYVCLLQPWVVIRAGDAKPRDSIDLNYNSLPPPLCIYRAFKARHIKLALICLMTLLANVLTVALGGLMYEDRVTLTKTTTLHQLYSSSTKNIERTDVPLNFQGSVEPQGGYGAVTMDQFYQAMSTITAGTQLPAWVDEYWAYSPVDLPLADNNTVFHVLTKALGASLECQLLDPNVLLFSPGTGLKGHFDIGVPILAGDGSMLNCTGNATSWESPTRKNQGAGVNPFGLDIIQTPSPDEGVVALELGLASGDGACGQHFLLGWLRADFEKFNPFGGGIDDDMPMQYGEIPSDVHARVRTMNTTLIRCSPTILQADAEIDVRPDGRVVKAEISNERKLTSPTLSYQSNRFLVDNGLKWHDNTSTADFVNYLMAEANHSTAFLDPRRPPPAFKDVEYNYGRLHRSMFAMFVANNFAYIFEPADAAAEVEGNITGPETRIFISLSAYIVSMAILCQYVLVTLWFYLQRPWNGLPRLPKSIASIIAYFAASNALEQMSPRNKDRDGHSPDESDFRWGYGTFIGPDGEKHVGIEREEWLIKEGDGIEMSENVVEDESHSSD
jgi:hypothetical protein